MRWFEKGIMFEGTPDEFRALHQEIVESKPVEAPIVAADTITPPEAQVASGTPREKKKGSARVWQTCVAELAGGGTRHFVSMTRAYNWYAEHCPVRHHRTYDHFKKAIRKAPIRFADAEIKLA